MQRCAENMQRHLDERTTRNLRELEKLAQEDLRGRTHGARRIASELRDVAGRTDFALRAVRLLEATLDTWNRRRDEEAVGGNSRSPWVGWYRRVVLALKVCYQELENIRCELHPELSASVMSADKGLTEVGLVT